MINVATKYESHMRRVEKAARQAVDTNIGRAAASLRKVAVGSIKRAPAVPGQPTTKQRKGAKTRRRHAASMPGTPPYTARGQAKRAILYAYDKRRQEAVIGPRGSVVGESMRAHEFGGGYKGSNYPARPFMGPALDATTAKYGLSFKSSIGA